MGRYGLLRLEFVGDATSGANHADFLGELYQAAGWPPGLAPRTGADVAGIERGIISGGIGGIKGGAPHALSFFPPTKPAVGV